MGLTHYWRRPEALPQTEFAAVVADFKKCLPVLKVAGADLAGPNGTGEPTLTDDLVEFTGRSPASCEPFYFEQVLDPFRWRRRPNDAEEGGVLGYCKTEGLPSYDLAVLVFLVLARRRFGSLLRVKSDGREAAHNKAEQLINCVLKEP